MYASALKCCGAMEVCGLGFPRDMPIDHSWPEVLAQAAAQRAGQLICYTRDFKPEEGEFLTSKAFTKVCSFANPRTGNVLSLWVMTLPAAISGAPVPL
jgi:hypothetical protein